MSWSIAVVGRAHGVAAYAEKHFNLTKCEEPEESIKQKVAEIVQIACGNMPEDSAIEIIASGSQYCTKRDDKQTDAHSVSVSIRPLFGFVE